MFEMVKSLPEKQGTGRSKDRRGGLQEKIVECASNRRIHGTEGSVESRQSCRTKVHCLRKKETLSESTRPMNDENVEGKEKRLPLFWSSTSVCHRIASIDDFELCCGVGGIVFLLDAGVLLAVFPHSSCFLDSLNRQLYVFC